MKSSRFHLPVSAWSPTPMVSDANGEISNTARPCKAIFSVAATSQRDDQVTRRIHKLHAMQQSVIAMRVVRAMSVAFEPRCTQQSVRLQRRCVTARPELGELRGAGPVG